MRMTEQDELMIQRCLDDELSIQDTRLLLSRLNEISDGWKTLACGFLQERSIARSVTGRIPAFPADVTSLSAIASPRIPADFVAASGKPKFTDHDLLAAGSAAVPPQALLPVRRQLRHWWSHPVTSLSLCAAIAFVAGLLIPDLRHKAGETHLADSGSAQRSISSGTFSGKNSAIRSATQPNARPENATGLPADYANYTVQFQPDNQPDRQPMNIPVTRDYDEVLSALRSHPQRFQQMLKQLPELRYNSPEAAEQLNTVRVPLDDKYDVLIFVDDRSFGRPAQ